MKSPLKTLFATVAALSVFSVAASPNALSQENPAPEKKKMTFLGVVAPPVEPSLRQHLELAEGFGLQVEHVLAESPAGKAGLRPHDVLTKLDDQLLTTTEHLALLVRMHKSGETVDLTYIRKGQEQTVSVALSEMDAPDLPMHPNPHQFGGPHGNPEEWQNAMRGYQDNLNKWLQENERKRGPNSPPNASSSANSSANAGTPGTQRPEPKGKPPVVSVKPGFPIQVFGSAGIVKIDNGYGEVTITEKDKKHDICIKDEKGEVVYEGAYDPGKGTAGLPPEAQDRLKKMKLDDLKVLAPGAPAMPTPEEDPKKEEIEKISEPVPVEVQIEAA